MSPLRIEVFADIACPWCYIGERRLEAALARLEGMDLDWVWRPFELQPDLPEAGIPWPEFVEQKFGEAQVAQTMFAHVANSAREDGIHFHFDRIPKAVRTLDAHRLVLFASAAGRGREAADSLFQAFFTEGIDLSRKESLIQIVSRLGLDADAFRDHLDSGGGMAEVEQSRLLARRFGITSVPCYIIGGKYALSGAHPQEVFDKALAQAVEQLDLSV